MDNLIVDEYSGTYNNGNTTLDPYLRVIEADSVLRLAGAEEIENGIVTRTVFPGDPAAVQYLHAQGRAGGWTMIAAGAISKGAPVYRAANGRVAATGTSKIGCAESAALAVGQTVRVRYMDVSDPDPAAIEDVVYKADDAQAMAGYVNVYSSADAFGTAPAVEAGKSFAYFADDTQLLTAYVANEAGDEWILVREGEVSRTTLTAAGVTDANDVHIPVDDRQGATPVSREMSVAELMALQETILNSISYQGLLLDGDTIDFDTNGRRLSYDINDDADVTLTSTVNGDHSLILRYSEGLKFDSSNDRITTATGGPTWNWNDPWTVMAWVKTTDHTADEGGIIGYGQSSGSYLGFYLSISSGVLYVKNRFGAGGSDQMNRYSVACSCNDGEWRHVAASWSGVSGDDITFYLDGAEVALDAARNLYNVTTGTAPTSAVFRLGDNTFYTAPFGGRIKQAKVFDAELSLSDINLAMRNKQTSTGALLCHWPMDEGAGGTIENVGTLDFDGTLSGPVWTAEGSYSLTSTGVTNLPSSVNDSTKVSLTRENGRWYS